MFTTRSLLILIFLVKLLWRLRRYPTKTPSQAAVGRQIYPPPYNGSGVLDHIFCVYLRDAEPIEQRFREWLETNYNLTEITLDFQEWRAGIGR